MSEKDLRQISTSWTVVAEPDRFVMRYAAAIHKYLSALVRDPHDADDICQDFLLHVKQKGFPKLDPERGRFRHYLIAVVRNVSRAFLAKKASRPVFADLPVEILADDQHEAAEKQYAAEWCNCLLDAAMQSLNQHERGTPGNLGHTILKLVLEHPEADSEALVVLAQARLSKPLNAASLRKQLSRARERFAEFLKEEVALTLEKSTPAEIEAELCDLGLMRYVRRYLKPDEE